MSGGSKGQMAPSASDPVVAAQPAHLQGTSPAMMDAFMPGQHDLLSKQLSAGYGPTPKMFADALRKVYQPAKTLDFTKAGTAPNAAASTSATSGAPAKKVDPNTMILIDGQMQPIYRTRLAHLAEGLR